LGLRAIENSFFDCDHNHVVAETHFGQTLWVHRKGASRAGDREAGIIPGSMGTQSFHTEGRGNVDALQSSSHGAGRAMSRGEAHARIRSADFLRKMRGVWFDERHARQLIEESPDAYKDIRQVMKAQRDLTRIVRTLRPVLSYKRP
jgi:tRNA-splicing ligase RtcB